MKKIWIVLIFVVAVVLLLISYSGHTHRFYQSRVNELLEQTEYIDTPVIEQDDLAHLPEPVQRYLNYVGVVGKEKIKNFKVIINGRMRIDRDKDWAPVVVEQYSFIKPLTRLFFITMKMNGLPLVGLHHYSKGAATWSVEMLGIVPVVDADGEIMNQAETVTVFNDICLMAPAALIDAPVEWETIDDQTVEGTFNYNDISVSAILHFNDIGQLTNFYSEDRYYSPDGEEVKNIPWTTPVTEYTDMNGYNLPAYGEAYWHFEDEDFCYAKFDLSNIQYNVEK